MGLYLDASPSIWSPSWWPPINFLLPRAAGDPVSVMFAPWAGAMMEPAALEALKATFGFVDGPIGTQFLTYVKSVFTWDLGTSVRYPPTGLPTSSAAPSAGPCSWWAPPPF